VKPSPSTAASQSRSAGSYPAFRDATHFAVNVLGGEHEDLCRRFARPHPDKFSGIAYALGEFGVPLLRHPTDALFQDMLEGDLSFRAMTEFLIARERTMEKKLNELARVATVIDRPFIVYVSTSKRAHIVELERELAEWMGTDDALVFTTGHQANMGALGTLLAPADTVVVDAADHASILDGVLLSRAKMRPFRHARMDKLARALERAEQDGGGTLVVVDGVFSLEGDVAPLVEITELCARHGARLLVANADNNCIAVIDVAVPGKSQVKGFIPTGWYPGALLLSADGKKLFVANVKGHGSLSQPRPAAKGKNSHDHLGSVSLIDLPDAAGGERLRSGAGAGVAAGRLAGRGDVGEVDFGRL